MSNDIVFDALKATAATLTSQVNALQVQASNDQRDNAKAELEHQREMIRMEREFAFKEQELIVKAQLEREKMATQAATAEKQSGWR